MANINDLCADAGTPGCPCPLAETGDCLVCGRLSGGDCGDCRWAGVCIYNEYVQNDKIIRNRRENTEAPVLKKIWYQEDLLALSLKVSRGFALAASRPGSFVFIKKRGASDFFNFPLSVMRTDVEKGELWLALKVISGKTKETAAEEESLIIRGVYRNGLLGKGRGGLEEDVKAAGIGKDGRKRKWLIMTKGAGFAPAVNLLLWAAGRTEAHVITDTEKINEKILRDYLWDLRGAGSPGENIFFSRRPLAEAAGDPALREEDYDRVIILASDYYIRYIWEKLKVPPEKLIFSNNFHMCCGEGICGACCHTDRGGNVSKMCKCGSTDVRELI